MRSTILILILLSICLILWQCKEEVPPPNQPPSITTLTANPDTMLVTESTTITCMADDVEGDHLSYAWEVLHGSFTGVGASITWTAPDSAGTFTITCKVIDTQGGVDSAQVEIVVEPIPIPTKGLIVYYPFNGNANDESGHSYHGTVNDATLVSDRFGIANRAFEFDGNNDYITANPVLPTGNEPRSISVWFNTTSASGFNGWNVNTIVSWGSPSNNRMSAVQVYKSELMFGAFGTAYDVRSGVLVNDGNWHHVVIANNGSTVTIYLDNEAIKSENKILNTSSSILSMGSRINQGNQYMDGLIDDVRIYDRTLTKDEVSALFKENGWKN